MYIYAFSAITPPRVNLTYTHNNLSDVNHIYNNNFFSIYCFIIYFIFVDMIIYFVYYNIHIFRYRLYTIIFTFHILKITQHVNYHYC